VIRIVSTVWVRQKINMNEKDEKRKLRRRSLLYDFEVIEKNTGASIGRIINISLEGMMLISTDRYMSDTIMDVSIKLPETIFGKNTVDCAAKCMWCKKNEHTDFYEVGFHLFELPEDDIKAIVGLITKYRLLD
jgi:hypothetical protein